MKKLIFKDKSTGETWEHSPDDWILKYCNFNSSIHPCLLRIGQVITVKDVNGHPVEIKMVLQKVAKVLALVLISTQISGCALLGMTEEQRKEARLQRITDEWNAQTERQWRYKTVPKTFYLESGKVTMTQKEYDEKLQSGQIRRSGDATIKVYENGKLVREVEIEADSY
jgi:hypothetical protein